MRAGPRDEPWAGVFDRIGIGEGGALGASGVDSATAEGDAGITLIAAPIMDLLNSYAVVFLVAFLVTLLATPLVRRMAIAAGVVDRPDEARKQHAWPIAYMGGVAVFLGIVAAIAMSFVLVDGVAAGYDPVPIAVVVGMVAIAATGLADDVWKWDPRLKVAGQLVAAAALAISDIGVNVAAGVLVPLASFFGIESLAFTLPVLELQVDVVYWTGTALIAVFVLGGCNAANLIDGLDGLLTGVVGIVAIGLIAIGLLMALQPLPDFDAGAPVTILTGARLVLAFALLGAVLGFLPHNFNPATIFLGDCGSHLLGYMCVVIILMFGEFGQTHLVFAGLIVFSVPIMDTLLAIVRRRVSGRSMSAADDEHIHHQLRRGLGGVKSAVLALYGISFAFAALGVALAALVMLTDLRVRVVYAIAIVLFSFIGVVVFKSARRAGHQERKAAERASRSAVRSGGTGDAGDARNARPTPLAGSVSSKSASTRVERTGHIGAG